MKSAVDSSPRKISFWKYYLISGWVPKEKDKIGKFYCINFFCYVPILFYCFIYFICYVPILYSFTMPYL